jgi:hypothetical protein
MRTSDAARGGGRAAEEVTEAPPGGETSAAGAATGASSTTLSCIVTATGFSASLRDILARCFFMAGFWLWHPFWEQTS